MKMMKWVKGSQTTASQVDPALGAAIAAVVEILIRFDLHTKLGLTPEDLLTTLLDIAFVVLTVRSIQMFSKKAPAAPALPPVADPPAPEGDDAA